MPASTLKPYDPELGEQICDALSCSDKSLSEVLEEMGWPISERTFYRWRESNEEFRQKSARARESQGHYLADKAIVEARTSRMGIVRKSTPKGNEETLSDNVERSKLIVQAYFKRAGQLNKELGDRTTLAGDPDNPLQVSLAESISQARKRVES